MNLNIDISKDGYRVLRIDRNNKNVYLGSKYNQKREIDKFISKFGMFTNKDNFIVLGLSFGEHIKELLNLIQKDSKILIVEFDKELIEYCECDEEVKKIINNDKIVMVNNIDEAQVFLRTYINEVNIEKIKVAGYCNYDQIYAEQSQEIYTLIRNYIAKVKINRNTFRVFGETFLNNTLTNLKYIAKSTEINALENVYKNKPAIIVSAGPSLIKNIEKLKGINNALIISGGRTLSALIERDIKPSCIGVLDPGEVSYKLVEPYIKDIDCPLIYTDLCNEKVIKEHKASKFFYTDSKFIWNVFGKEIMRLYGGGSVAHTLTNLAIYMGCNPIIFIGQDLAYTGDRGHAVCSGNRWDELSFEDYKNTTDIYVKDIYGDRVRTSLVLNEYRLAFEEIIKNSPDIKFINATEGGANIEGAENKKLQAVLDELEKETIIPMERYIKNIDRTGDTIKELEYNIELIKKYISLCRKAKKYLKDYKTNYLLRNKQGLNDILNKLDKIDKEIVNKNIEISLIAVVITKVVYEIENDDKFIVNSFDSKDIALNKEISRSETLYSKIEEVLNMCNENIEKIIIKLKEEH